MTRAVVVDASALAALIFQEPESDAIRGALRGATVSAPHLLKSELSNIAWKKSRRHPVQIGQIMSALQTALTGGRINWIDVDPIDAALVALETGTTAYDATYLWLAGHLGADLVTLDRRLISASTV